MDQRSTSTVPEALTAKTPMQPGPALTLYLAYFASQSRHVMVNLNFPDLLNFPKHVPIEIKFGLEIEVARCIVLTGK